MTHKMIHLNAERTDATFCLRRLLFYLALKREILLTELLSQLVVLVSFGLASQLC